MMFTPTPCGCVCHMAGSSVCQGCCPSKIVLPNPQRDGLGTKDGVGSMDNDQPFVFGNKPTVTWPTPFTHHEFARLLVLRGRVYAEWSRPCSRGGEEAAA
jgi:hypothetical protein